MFQGAYEEMVQFASRGPLGVELRQAKAEFVTRTGDMFESDTTFEQRLATFLEWHTLDRPLQVAPSNGQKTPCQLYLEHLEADVAPDVGERRATLEALSKSVLSLYEFRRLRANVMHVVDLLSGEKLTIYVDHPPVGIGSKDIFEARAIALPDRRIFAETYTFIPRDGRRAILSAIKIYKKRGILAREQRIAFVHQVSYYTNRCARYRHVSPKQIFAALEVAA